MAADRDGYEIAREWLKQRQSDFGPTDLAAAASDLSQSFEKLDQYTQSLQPIGIVGLADKSLEVHTNQALTGGDALLLPTALAIGAITVIVKDFADNLNTLYQAGAKETLREAGESIAQQWEEFKQAASQVVEDVQREIAELVSPESPERLEALSVEQEKAQEKQAAAEQEKAQEKQAADTEAMKALAAEQKKAQEKQAADIKAMQDQVRENNPDSPELKERLAAAEKAAVKALADRQAAERQALQEQLAMQQQALQR